MRTLGSALVLVVVMLALGAPLAAQTNRAVFLYSLEASGSGSPPLHVFTVNPATGALTENAGSPFATGLNACCLSVDPTGRFLYVANTQSNDITAYSVNSVSGSLSPLSGSPFTTGPNPEAIAVDPTGRFLYVSTFGASPYAQTAKIYVYAIDSSTGVLSAAPGSPFAASAIITSITLAPNANFAFLSQVLSSRLPLLVESVDFATGALHSWGSASPRGASTYTNFLNPNGKFLYTTDASSGINGQVSVFAFDPGSGSLSEIAASPFPVGPVPFSMATDPSGHFLYVLNSNAGYQTTSLPSDYTGGITGYVTDPVSGSLRSIAGSPFPAGINPRSIVVDPTGRFVYYSITTYPRGGYAGNANVAGLGIDPTSGVLTPLAGSPWMDSTPSTVGFELAISFAPLAGNPSPMPLISSLSPSSVAAGGAGFTIQVNGNNFVPGATIYLGGQSHATNFVSSTQLTATISSAEIADGGTAVVFVFNPLPGGGASTSIGLAVVNPSPTLSSLSPSSVVASGSGIVVDVTGSNFVTSSTASFNGVARPTVVASSTKLTVTLPTSDVSSPGPGSITVTNPSNGVSGAGGISNALTLTILPAPIQPIVGSLVPASATAGGPGFTLSIIGTSFTPNSIVTFNLSAVATTFLSPTQMQATIPASAIALAGSPVVIVTNPSSGIQSLATFTVNNPPPGAGGVSPPAISAGAAALTLSVAGTNFTQGSIVLVNGSARVTTYVSATLVQATLLSSDISHGGTLNISVTTPPPGGGTTAAIALAVSDYSVAPVAATASVAAGQPANFSLTVAPSNGAFANPITFAVTTTLPTGVTASFSSSTVTPGAAATNVSLSFTTTARSSAPPSRIPQWPKLQWLLLTVLWIAFGCVLLMSWRGMNRMPQLAPRFLLATLIVCAGLVIGCGGGSGGSGGISSTPAPGGGSATGTPAGSYPIGVSATSGGVAHSTTVTLTVM